MLSGGRVSKGNNPKKDILSSTINLKELTTVPLSSPLPTASTYEDALMHGPEQNERDDFDASEDSYEPDKPAWKKNRKQSNSVSALHRINDENPMARQDGRSSQNLVLRIQIQMAI